MARIAEADIRELKKSVSILHLCAQHGIELKQQGAHSYIGRCPFHNDNNPSLSIDAVKNVWHCFGCNKGGTVIDFIMEKEGIPFRQAIDRLMTGNSALCRASDLAKATSDKSQLPDPAPPIPPEPSGPEQTKLIADVIGFYHAALSGSDERGRKYLQSRGLADPDTLKTFKVGYVNGTLKDVLPAAAIEPLKDIGILNARGNEFFTGCIVVPVFTETGELGEMYGRSVEKSRHLYLPGPHRGVLNAAAAEVYDELILTEAILDALSLYSIGHRNVIPCYGTGGFTPDHAALFQKHNVKKAFIAFDNDAAGDAAAGKLAKTLTTAQIDCRRVHIPKEQGKDLNDYVQALRREGMPVPELKHAAAALLKKAPRIGYERPKAGNLTLVDQDRDTLYFQNCEVNYRLRGLFDNGTSSMRLVVSVNRNGTNHTDRFDLYTAKSRKTFACRAAHHVELPAARIESDLDKLIPVLETILAENRSETKEKPQTVPAITHADKQDAMKLLRSNRLLDRISADLDRIGFVGEDQGKQLAYLIATSRKLDKPLSGIVRSESGAGKSYLMECVADLMPPEDVQYYSRLTPQSLYYMGKDELVHKLLIVDERDGSEESEYPIRTLQTRRKLTLAVPVKDPSTGAIKTRQIEIHGPIAYMESTTSIRINPENANRSFEIFLDESEEQTRRIYAAQKKAHTLEGWKGEDRRDRIIRRHHNAQRLLKPVRVLIPYTDLITFPASWTRSRRDHDRLLYLVEAIAFLHQFQREVKRDPDRGEYIEATVEDYTAAYHLAKSAFGHALSDIPRTARTVLSHIQTMAKEWSQRLGVEPKDYGFRRRDVREYTRMADHVVKRAMKTLADLEYLNVKRSGRGGTYIYHLAARPGQNDVLQGLTTPEELGRAWLNA